MTAESSGNGARSADHEPEPVEGLRLRALPTAGEPAFPLEHACSEIVYAPLVGRTAVLLARAMARHHQGAGGSTTVSPVELAMEVGIRASSSHPLGQKSHPVHAVDRVADDHVVPRLGDRVLGLRVAVAPLVIERSPSFQAR